MNKIQSQILSISLTFIDQQEKFKINVLQNVFIYFLNKFNHLEYLNIQTFSYDHLMSFNDLIFRKQLYSETLLQLCINVKIFDDVLYILDGRFDQLQILSINIYTISSQELIDNKVN